MNTSGITARGLALQLRTKRKRGMKDGSSVVKMQQFIFLNLAGVSCQRGEVVEIWLLTIQICFSASDKSLL